jgi:SAM-dependent methyltransferase
MPFSCNTCGSARFERTESRGDGKRVLFCAVCGMGMIEDPPASTDFFYDDGYYGVTDAQAHGYHDYELTSAHTQLWVQLLIKALAGGSSRILDIGCADGTMLQGLPDSISKYGIEANAAAASVAAARGVTILSSDVADPKLATVANSFDIVSSIATFEHVLDMRGAFEIALRCLKEDGLLIFEVPLMSATADNKDWLHGSYEHITYPTVEGLKHLLDSLPGVHWHGFESQILGFSASYIGIVTHSPETFNRANALLRAMRSNDDPAALTTEERRLNIGYKLVHSFETRPELVLALPDLFEVASSKPLLRRLSQIWYGDTVKAKNADYYEKQAAQWQAAWHDLNEMTVSLQEQVRTLQEQVRLTESRSR